MTVTLYIPKENGDLKFLADIEDVDHPALALDGLFDAIAAKQVDMRRPSEDTFVAVTGSLDDGNVVTLVLEDDAPVQPKRKISVSRDGFIEPEAKPKRRGPGRPRRAETEDEGEAPARRKPGRPKGSGKKTDGRSSPEAIAKRKATMAKNKTRPGRPKGSGKATAKRGSGRPKGSTAKRGRVAIRTSSDD
jgi:hypothetical protein